LLADDNNHALSEYICLLFGRNEEDTIDKLTTNTIEKKIIERRSSYEIIRDCSNTHIKHFAAPLYIANDRYLTKSLVETSFISTTSCPDEKDKCIWERREMKKYQRVLIYYTTLEEDDDIDAVFVYISVLK
jgi:hypothetical protein